MHSLCMVIQLELWYLGICKLGFTQSWYENMSISANNARKLFEF